MKFQKVTAQKLKKDLRAKRIFGLAVDIDDTLSYTDYYWFERMRTGFANPEKLSLEKLIKKYKRFSHVPYWKSEKAQKFIIKLFNSNEFQANIPLIKDARRAINKINKTVPIAAYITGRPVATYSGTRKWLDRNGFPDAPVILLPVSMTQKQRHLWKARLLKFLYPQVKGIIEDHPYIKRELKAVGYKGKLFLYDNKRNTKRYHPRLKRFYDWAEIVSAISLS